MGWFSRTRKRHRILLLGMPSVGKTTLLYRLANQPIPDIMVPTSAPSLKKHVTSPDGHKFIFSEQKAESSDADAIIFVVSWSDLQKGSVQVKEFVAELKNPNAPLMVLVNKQDLETQAENKKNNMDEIACELAPIMGTNRSWIVNTCSAKDNTGLSTVVEWLETKLPLY